MSERESVWAKVFRLGTFRRTRDGWGNFHTQALQTQGRSDLTELVLPKGWDQHGSGVGGSKGSLKQELAQESANRDSIKVDPPET